jgi:hypothetical protein
MIRKAFLIGTIATLALASSAGAAFNEMWQGSVSYTSDAEGDKTVALPSFDTTGGRTLLSVRVDIWSDASVDIAGDNDDPFKTASVSARMIRNYRMDGPGVVALSLSTTNGPVVNLGVDDTDGGNVLNFDSTPLDGTAFGTLSYTGLPAIGSPFTPANALYATAGPGIVNFTVLGNGTPGSALLMVNDQQFFGVAPDAWQLMVENPILVVNAKVTYEWIPEPATLSLLGLGALVLRRVRR